LIKSKLKNKILYLLGLIFTAFHGMAQEPFMSDQSILSDLIEDIASSTEESLDYALLYEDLIYYAQHPLNLNDASEEELQKLYLLTDYQIQSLQHYIKSHGPLRSVYELQLVYGFDEQLIRKLSPFIKTQPPDNRHDISVKNAVRYGRHQLFMRSTRVLEEQKGYAEIPDSVLEHDPDKNRYLGNPYKIYTRYTFSYKQQIQMGFVAEKDPGEEFFTGSNQHHFDYQSAHFFLNKKGTIRKIALGDYQASFGQGLILWSGMGFGKSPYVLNNSKHGRGLNKYSSTNENQFMRGAAGTIRFNDIEFTGFYSNKNIDANITQYDSSKNIVQKVSSLQNSGIHATPSQLNDEDVLNEQMMGGHVSYHAIKYRIGATILYYTYDAIIMKEPAPYNQYDFSGRDNINAGIDYKFIIKDAYFFGESAIGKNKGIATINGANLSLFPGFDMSLIHRYYQKDYQAYYSNAFSENTTTSNEAGFYTGVKASLLPKWTFSAFCDVFSFPWLKYLVDAPSYGSDYHFQADYMASDNLNMYWRIKQNIKQRNSGADSLYLNLPTNNYSTKLRYHIAYKITDALHLKNRIELHKYKTQTNSSNGFLVYQDIGYKTPGFPLTINFRYAIFDTDSYNTRIYAYENDLLYAFSVPAYYYKGTRLYLLLKYDINQYIDLWIKCGQTYYSNQESIGTGLNEIRGDRKTEIKGQVRVKF